jgi:hypothetical protein
MLDLTLRIGFVLGRVTTDLLRRRRSETPLRRAARGAPPRRHGGVALPVAERNSFVISSPAFASFCIVFMPIATVRCVFFRRKASARPESGT